ncbi:DNA polymerase III subunit beta [Dictyobacter alpinus]|uniref:Beta sliding clamp n=1 Tax=Dictyobacter alpinus TaxID=2014873 RepID=A0A402BLA3_9CHLR|nr:DNA polymerase III subunit beta [Dictyobacter alpinus]GCE32106.1 DNA polymerase III subunit beta [Dictyobacter alpinus]
MKVCCKKADIASGLAMVGRATSNRALPILSTIKITTEQNRILLEATNLELGVQCRVDATVEQPGCCALPARLLTDFIAVLPHETITIEVSETHAGTITSELSEAEIIGMDPNEFPRWPQADENELSLHLAAQTIKEMVTDVAFSASTDDDRPAFTGICIQVGRNGEGKITCAAADAYRLAVRSEVLEGDVPEPVELVVPAKTLKEIATLLPTQGMVSLTVTAGKKQILFQTDGVSLTSRLMDAAYPNFWQMVPDNYSTRSVVETRLFAPVIKAAALFAQDASHTLTLKLRPATGKITVSASAEGIGANTSTLTATYSDPVEDFTMLFNVRYIADALAAMSSVPEIALELHNANRPGILRPVGKKDVLYLVMPMQVKRETKSRPATTTATS